MRWARGSTTGRSSGVLWFVLVGMVGGLGGRYMGMISIKLVGLARTPILTQTGLIWSTGLAVILLGETLTPLVTLGTLGIMARAGSCSYTIKNPSKDGFRSLITSSPW